MTINLYAYLRDHPKAIRVARDFIDKRLLEIREDRTAFRGKCKFPGQVFFSGFPFEETMGIKAFRAALEFLTGNDNERDKGKIPALEEQFYQYIIENLTSPENKAADNVELENPYSSLSNYDDGNLPYYNERAEDSFFNLHLDILKQSFTDKEFEIFKSRLLRETIDGKEYIFPAVNLLEDNIAPLSLASQINFDDESTTAVPEQFVDAIKKFMPKMFDAPTFTLNTLEKDSNTLTLSTSSYFKTLYACDRYFYNVVANFPGINSQGLEKYKQSATMDEWVENLKDIVIDNKFSADTSIGCSCMLIYKNNNNGYEYFVGNKLASSNGFKETHIIPSSMFQPLIKNKYKYNKDKSIINHVLKELSEEVFQSEDFEAEGHSDNAYDDVLNTPHNKSIVEMLETGGAEFHITGLWLDMFRLRPEITCSLIIDDKDWYVNFVKAQKKLGNWEIEKGALNDVDMAEGQYKMTLKRQAGFMCAPGLAALVSGLNKFKSLGLDN